MGTPRSTPSPHLVLPPIVANEKDRDFLVALNAHIDGDLGRVNRENPEQRYIVYKSAFDQIIDYVTAYKPLLTAVKAEYEDCIETIRRGQREAFYLSGKVKAMVNEPSTIRNYKKRSEDLDLKLSVIEDDNAKLKEQLESLRAARLEKERQAKETAEPPKKVVKRDKRATIPGLTLHQSTDLKTLQKELEKLERQFRELTISHRTRYSPKEHQVNLKSVLDEKVSLRDQLQEQTELMKMKRQKLKIAVEAAQAYMKIQPPHQTIGESVVSALQRARTQNQFTEKGTGDEGMPRGTPSTTFEEDDPTREKEAEMMLEYIEKFNELLEDDKYEEAAIHAANSPKGILRTPETLQRFKDMKGLQTGSGRTPLLAYCDALMATVLAYGVKPSDYMSVECVKCALDENRMDLVSHWISQDRLTNTVQLGDLMYHHCVDRPQATKSCLSLAQRVYSEAEAHVPAVVCMIRLGRINQGLEYALKNKMEQAQYIELLKQCPGPQLAKALFETKFRGNSLLPLGVIVNNLLKTDIETNVGLYLIQDIYLHGPQEPGKDSSPIRRAVFDDKVTTEEQWVDIVQKLQEIGYGEVGIDILAAVTVYNAVTNASKYAEEIEKEKQAEKKAEQQKEAKEKSEAHVDNKTGSSIKEKKKGKEKDKETDEEEKEEGKRKKRKSKGKKKKRIVEESNDKSDGYDPDDGGESDNI